MKSLSHKQKRFIYEKLINGRYRFVAKPLYDLIINIELALHRTQDALFSVPINPPHMSEVTAVIKTFERPKTLCRLVKSMRRYFPELPILVADDSREPSNLPDAKTLALPYNSGVSVGRNKALEVVSTKYLLILDDDFVFTRHTRIADLVGLLERHMPVDIVGGQVIDLPLYIRHDYRGIGLFPSKANPVFAPGTIFDGKPVVEKVPNFFVARTDRLRLVKWDTDLKLLEHADFFTRARGVLTTVLDLGVTVLHARTPFDFAYMQIRHNTEIYRRKLQARYHPRPPAP